MVAELPEQGGILAFWVQIPVATCLLFGLAFVAGFLLVTAVRCRMLVFPAAC